jgi:predicted dinucleotide-binding enzyme
MPRRTRSRWPWGTPPLQQSVYIYATLLDFSPAVPVSSTVLYCGGDESARALVGSLIRRLGFQPLDAGPLRNARYIEPFAQLVVYFVRKRGYDPMQLSLDWPVQL